MRRGNRCITFALNLIKRKYPLAYLLYRILYKNKNNSVSAKLVKKYDALKMRFLPDYIQPIFIETYDGLNQTVHPDVICNTHNNEKLFIMLITPYPFGDDRYENPCVYVSKDGLKWVPPEKADNPLAMPDANGQNHLSDPEVIYSDNVYWVYYRESIYRDSLHVDRIYRIESKNLRQWSVPTLMLETPERGVISPSIIRYDDIYHIYYVNCINNNTCLKRCLSWDGTFKNEEILDVDNIPTGRMLWHIDIFVNRDLLGGLFVLAKDAEGHNSDLYYAESNDGGIHWRIKNKIYILRKQEKYFNSIYRSSIVKNDNGSWSLFFSAKTKNYSWHTFVIRDFNPEDYYIKD